MATGHATGVCAALAAREKVLPATIDHRAVQRAFLRQGANLRPDLREQLEKDAASAA